MPHRALYDAALAVGRSAFEAGLVGHAMVDFVTLLEQQQTAAGAAAGGGGGGGGLRLWLVDLRPGIMPSLVAFQLFDFLAGRQAGMGMGGWALVGYKDAGGLAATAYTHTPSPISTDALGLRNLPYDPPAPPAHCQPRPRLTPTPPLPLHSPNPTLILTLFFISNANPSPHARSRRLQPHDGRLPGGAGPH